jgi:hypothetical protein
MEINPFTIIIFRLRQLGRISQFIAGKVKGRRHNNRTPEVFI